MKPKYLIIHHTAGTAADPKADTSHHTVEIINEWHKKQFNFKSSLGYYVGYQYVIEKDGKVTQCRKDTEEGAHTIGKNKSSIGIVLTGNFDETLPTDAQREALTKLLREKMAEHDIPASNIVPHRNFSAKSCYGSRLLENWARDLVSEPVEQNPLEKYKSAELINELKRRVDDSEL